MLPELLLILQFVPRHLVHLCILSVLLSSALQFDIEGVVALGIALVAIVGRNLIVALLFSFLFESCLVLAHITLGIVTFLQLGLGGIFIGRIVAAFVGPAV